MRKKIMRRDNRQTFFFILTQSRSILLNINIKHHCFVSRQRLGQTKLKNTEKKSYLCKILKIEKNVKLTIFMNMRKKLLAILFAAATCSAVAQNKDLDYSKAEGEKSKIEFSVNGLSGMSSFLYLDLKQGKEDLAEKYDFVQINGQWNVIALMSINADKTPLLEQFGISRNGTQKSKFNSFSIPVDNFVAFVESNIADYIDIGDRAQTQMDSARYYTHADWAQAGRGNNVSLPKGYCGKDVVVGIVDIGFDYTHRNFFDSTETKYRVVRVWDQNNNGTPPSGYSYGNEMKTRAQILAALYSHNDQTHGSHVAGIAGGGGANCDTTKQYKGMAPESDLVFVSASGNSSLLFDGITYILNYADSIGKPCVINLSWGSQVGPHDGTAAIDQNCDYLINNYYTEGSLIVISAGNDGAMPLHLSKEFSSNDTSIRTFLVTTNYEHNVNNYIDIWGEVGNTFSVRVSVVDTVTGQVISTTRFGMGNSTSGSTSIANCNINYYIYPQSSLNNKPNITLYINNSNESIRTRKVLIEVCATRGTVHEWAYQAYLSSCQINGVQAGNTNYTINAWGQADKQIMVASYNTRRYWYNPGVSGWYHMSNATPVGARSVFSSIGPSLTSGKIKPDISAPGCVIISSYNYGAGYNFSSPYITHSIYNGNHNSVFGAMQGTSMAAPAASGIIALWLEAYPYLTVDQVKYLFNNHSITDNYTGVIPASGSVYFGRGKIDAFAGLQTILQKTAKPVITLSGDTTLCTGQTLTMTAPAGYAQYYWSNGDTTRAITVSQQGSYSVRLVSAEGFRTPYSDTIRVRVLQRLTTTISHDTIVCVGNSVSLTVNGGAKYHWSTGDTTATINAIPLTTTTYTVISDSVNRCSKTDSVTVTVLQPMTTTISRDTNVCSGNSVSLTVNGGATHLWNTGDTTATISVTPSSTTTYTVVSDSAGKCPQHDSVTVTVLQYLTTSISRDTAICIGESVALAVSGGTSQLWSTGDTTVTIVVTPSVTAIYSVISEQTGFCSKTDSVTVTVKRYVSNWWVSNDTTVCPGEFVTLTARGGDSYAWMGIHPGWDTNQTIIYEVMYPWQPILVRIDSTGLCSVWDSLNIYAYPQAHVEIRNQAGEVADHYGVRWDIPDYSTTLTATGQTGQTYLWSTGDTTASITVSPTVPTLYSVVSTTEHGCMDSISVTVLCLNASISTADELGFKLYPNPASTSVTIEGANMSEITIYNTLGQVVKKFENNDKDTIVIPLKDFAKGVYVTSVKDSLGKTGRRTFVVK